MIESVCDLHMAVDNSLKKIGHAELCLHSNDVELLEALRKFLNEFDKLTERVSSTVPVLSMVPLMKLKIKRICQMENDDDEAIKDLKNYVLMNVDRRLSENEFMKINQVFDPMTKDIFSQDNAISLLQRAFTLATQKGILTTSPVTPTATPYVSSVSVTASTSTSSSAVAVNQIETDPCSEVNKP